MKIIHLINNFLIFAFKPFAPLNSDPKWGIGCISTFRLASIFLLISVAILLLVIYIQSIGWEISNYSGNQVTVLYHTSCSPHDLDPSLPLDLNPKGIRSGGGSSSSGAWDVGTLTLGASPLWTKSMNFTLAAPLESSEELLSNLKYIQKWVEILDSVFILLIVTFIIILVVILLITIKTVFKNDMVWVKKFYYGEYLYPIINKLISYWSTTNLVWIYFGVFFILFNMVCIIYFLSEITHNLHLLLGL